MKKVFLNFVIIFVLFLNLTVRADDTTMTRAEFADVVMDTYEYITQEFVLPMSELPTFSDISQTTYSVRIEQAYVNGFINGVSEELYMPERELTVCEMAVVFYRLVNKLESQSSLGLDKEMPVDIVAPQWSKPALCYMNAQGILEISDSQFDAYGLCTREIALSVAEKIKKMYTDDADNKIRIDFETFLARQKGTSDCRIIAQTK